MYREQLDEISLLVHSNFINGKSAEVVVRISDAVGEDVERMMQFAS